MIIESPVDRGGKVEIDMKKNLFGRFNAKIKLMQEYLIYFYVWLVNFIDRLLPERWRSVGVEDNSTPAWSQSISGFFSRNKKTMKMVFMGLLIATVVNWCAPIFTQISDNYNDTNMLIELRLLNAERASNYVVDKLSGSSTTTKAPRPYCGPGSEDLRKGTVYCKREWIVQDYKESNTRLPDKYREQPIEEEEEEDYEQDEKMEDFMENPMFNPLEICGVGQQFQTYRSTQKVFCWDVVQKLLDTKYNKASKKRKSSKEDSGDFNCLCSDYFGLSDIDFVYMGYKGKESTLLISPQVLPYEKNKKAEYFAMSMEQTGDVGETHAALAKLTGTEEPISQQATVKASYYTPPTTDQLNDAYPWAPDVQKGVNNLKFSEIYTTSTGIYPFDLIISGVKFADSLLNDGRRDKYALTTFMEERIRRIPTEKVGKEKSILSWSNKGYDKTKPRSLVHVKESEFPIPYGTCLLHCSRLRDSLNKKK